MSNGPVVLLRIAPASHADIAKRLQDLGPEYVRDYTKWHFDHGPVIVFGEVGLVADQPTISEIVEEKPS